MDQVAGQKTKVASSDDDLKKFVWDTVMAAALATLFAAVPFLAVPPLSWLITWVATLLGNILYDGMKETAGFLENYLTTEASWRAFDDASIKLKIAARAYGPDSKEYKDARKLQTERLREFVSLRPR